MLLLYGCTVLVVVQLIILCMRSTLTSLVFKFLELKSFRTVYYNHVIRSA